MDPTRHSPKIPAVTTASAGLPPSSELIQFAFHGDTIDCARVGGRVRIAVTSICANLGIDRRGQQAKLATKSWSTGELISVVAADGRRRDVYCIDIDALPMWLATIEPSRVKESLRPKLHAYQLEAATVLRNHFLGAPPLPTPRLSGGDDPTSMMVASFRANLQMAERFQRMEQDNAQLAAVQATQGAEIRELRAERTEVLAASIAAEPTSLFLVTYDKERLYIRKTAQAYGIFLGGKPADFEAAWNVAYDALRDIGRFDARVRCDNQKGPKSARLSKIDIVAAEHKMTLFASLVKTHMGDVMERATQGRLLSARVGHA